MVTGTQYFSSLSSSNEFTTLYRQSVTLDGSIEELVNVDPATGTNFTAVTVGELITSELLRTGKILESDINLSALSDEVRGISLKDRGSIKNTLSSLQEAYLFDLVEEDYKITAELRRNKTVVRTITHDELGASEGDSGAEEFKITTPRRGEIPARYYLTYRNPDEEYDPASIVWQDPSAKGEATLDIKVPVALTEDEAYNLIRRRALSTISARVGQVQISTSFKHSDLNLGDYINILLEDGRQYPIRIANIDKGRPGVVKISGIVDVPANYAFDLAVGDPKVLENILRQVASPILVQGLPFLQGQDGLGYWTGAYSLGDAQVFSSLLKVFTATGNPASPGTGLINVTPVGRAVNALPVNATEGAFDHRFDLEFLPLAFEDGFSTATQQGVMSSTTANTYWYGSGESWELIKILTMTPTASGTIVASGILRGYKGTSHHSLHESGDYLVGAHTGTLKKVNLGLETRGVGVRFILDDPGPGATSVVSKYITDGSLRPQPPIKLRGYKKDDGTFYFEWKRQSRYAIEWIDEYDVGVDEAVEQYTVYTLDTGNNNQILTETIVTEQNIILPDTGPNVTVAVSQYSEVLNTDGYISEIVTL